MCHSLRRACPIHGAGSAKHGTEQGRPKTASSHWWFGLVLVRFHVGLGSIVALYDWPTTDPARTKSTKKPYVIKHSQESSKQVKQAIRPAEPNPYLHLLKSPGKNKNDSSSDRFHLNQQGKLNVYIYTYMYILNQMEAASCKSHETQLVDSF